MDVVQVRRLNSVRDGRIQCRFRRAVFSLIALLCLQLVSPATEPVAVSDGNSQIDIVGRFDPTSNAMPLQLAQRSTRKTQKVASPQGRFNGPKAEATPPAIEHGIEVGPGTVGLAGAGVRTSKMTNVTGGKASALANTTDPESGRPMLSQLNIKGQLTIDVPCVLDRCRVTQVGGLYAVRNSSSLEFEARFCEFDAVMSETGEVADAVILNPIVVRRCIIRGGEDGMKLSSAAGCLIEESWIYGQIAVSGSHNDGIQAVKGTGDPETRVVRRCRVEGPWRRQTSAMLFQADMGDLSGITVQDCLLAGGNYALYTRAKTGYQITKIRIVGNVWAEGSYVYGPYSNDCQDLEWSDNWIAPATTQGPPVEVDLNAARHFLR